MNAERKIPVLGTSLDALRAFPEGFDRYRTNSASLSAAVNKFLKENGLKETDGHTMYGLRHAFEDRMLEARIDERIRRDLMGHALGRVRYGQGGHLPMWLIALGRFRFKARGSAGKHRTGTRLRSAGEDKPKT